MILYNYKATVISVVDGDTVKLRLDLGFRLYWRVNCRLAGINAPEISTVEGVISKVALTQLLAPETEVVVNSTKLDKYGRPVAIIYLKDVCINDKMIADGYAVKYEV